MSKCVTNSAPCRRLGWLGEKLAASLLAGAFLIWAPTASATPEFPGIVEKTLHLPAITIDPPQGCTLCHPTDSGGSALRPLGTLVQQYGAQPYQDGTLEAALGLVQENDPQLIADIEAGRDPNDDNSSTALPTPQYGCSVGRGGGDPRLALGWAALAVVVAAIRRSRLRRPGEETRPSPRRARQVTG